MNTRLKIAIIMGVAALGSVVLYALDVITKTFFYKGFLNFDATTRGIVLGLPSVVLLIIAYHIAKKEKSQSLGWLIFITGMSIEVGAISSLLTQQMSFTGSTLQVDSMVSFAAIIVLGVYITILGLKKVQ